MATAMQELQLPSQQQIITALWPNYIVRWETNVCK